MKQRLLRHLTEIACIAPDYEKVPVETKTLITETGSYRALIQYTEVGHQRYIDKSWRLQ